MTQKVRELRGQGLSPREIARSLGIKTAEASALVRKLAAERDSANPDADLLGCWLNAGWSAGLGVPDRADWRDSGAEDGNRGPADRDRRPSQTSSAQDHGLHLLGRCLLPWGQERNGPRRDGRSGLRSLSAFAFGAYSAPPVNAPIDLVCDLVLGAVEFARGLALRPIRTSSRPARTLVRGQVPARSRSVAMASRIT